jgi:glyoxylase-like metal-dependent hydrolase (beta-lactamase superfamily II)
MAPHWKCGSGQPVAGSNPALSANLGRIAQPSYVQATEWDVAHSTDHTILEWIDFPAARYIQLGGDHEPFEGLRIIATPGHTPGHQLLAVETDQGLTVLAGQAVYTVDEWAGAPDELEGRSSAPDREAIRPFDEMPARARAGARPFRP